MKRILATFLCALMLFNFIFANSSYAFKAEGKVNPTDFGMTETPVNQNIINDMMFEGGSTDPRSGKAESFDLFSGNMGNVLGTVLGIVCMLLDIIPLTAEVLLTIIKATGTDAVNSLTDDRNDISFTIEKTVFNQVGMFNTDFFDFNTEVKSHNFFGTMQTSETDTIEVPDSIVKIKESVATWFIICRLIAMALGLLVLIYVGIRMAISTIAEDKAKYKKMLIGWIEAMIILFLLQYIIQIIITLGKLALDIAFSFKSALEDGGTKSFEMDLINSILVKFLTSSGTGLMVVSIMLFCLAFSHLRFFLLYLKRTIMLGFLIIVSPLITITYPIDKIGDNKAQAFQAWLNEFLILVFIQPIHAVIYLIFAFTAGEIVKYAPMMGLIFFMAIPSAEKMVRNLFGLGKSEVAANLKDIEVIKKQK